MVDFIFSEYMPAFRMKQIHRIQTPNSAVYICYKTFSGNCPEYFFPVCLKGNYIKIELFRDSYFFSLDFSHTSKFSIDS